MEYERLTGKSECGYNNLDACLNCDLEMDCGLCPYWAKALDRLAELEDKIEQGTLIELPRVLRYVDYECAIEKFVVQWQENGRIKQKSYFSEKKAYHRLKELQNG